MAEEEDRFPWQVRVLDDRDRHDYVKVGAINGVVITKGPSSFRMNPDEADLLDFAYKAATARARRQLMAARDEH